MRDLFKNMQRNYFRIYFHYTYFNVARYAFLNATQFLPLIAVGPSIVGGPITLGVVPADHERLQQRVGLVPLPDELVDDDHQPDLDLPASARLRTTDPRRTASVFANDYDDDRYMGTGTVAPTMTPAVAPE